MDLYICLMEAKEKALRLCQQIAMTSFDTEFNNGTTLQLELAKKIAIICVDEILSDKHGCGCEQSIVIGGEYQTYIRYWTLVKEEINNL